MSSPYETALQSGYSPEEITAFLMKKDPAFAEKFKTAVESGYQPEEVLDFYSKKNQPKPQEENLLSGALRQGGRAVARTAETVLGAPRAFGEFLESVVPEQALKKGAEKIGLGKPAEFLLEKTKKYAPYKLFPKSQDIRELNKFIFGGKLEPKNEFERFSDDVISDFAALALPLPGSNLKAVKPLVLSLGGNVASEALGHLGGTEKEKSFAKLGTILIGSLANPGGAQKLANELYGKAREARPANVRVQTSNLNKRLNQVERELKRGGSENWKPKLFTKIEEIRKQMAGNNIEVGELERFKPTINNIIGELKAEKNATRFGIKSAKRYANQLAHAVDEALTDYGRQNPKWEKAYREANEIHGTIAQSNKVRNYLIDKLGTISPHLTATLFGIGHGPGATLTGLGAGAAATAGAVESGALLARVWNSPRLRKYYYGVIQNAIKEDAVAMRENMRKLEEALEKEDHSQ